LTVKKETLKEDSSYKGIQKLEEAVLLSKDLENLEVFLKKVNFTKTLIQEQERELVLDREKVSLGEENLNRLKLEIQTLQGEFERFRDLYRVLNGVFG
jgi:hypothetical protein